MSLKKTLHPVPPELYFGGSLGLEDPVTEQSDLGVGCRDPKGSLGQDPLGKTIFLYSTEGLLPFGTLLTGLGTGKPGLDSRAWDAEFLSNAPDRPFALVVLLNGIPDILLRISHLSVLKSSSKYGIVWPKIDLVVGS